MIEIPKQLQDKYLRFIRVAKQGKMCIDKEWTTKNNFSWDSDMIQEHIKKGGSYGVLCGVSNLMVIDFDDEDFQNKIQDKLPETFTVASGGKGLKHMYFFTEKPMNKRAVIDENGRTLCDLQGIGSQVIGPGSMHKSGNRYKVINDTFINSLSDFELEDIFGEYVDTKKKTKGSSNYGKNNKGVFKYLKYEVDGDNLLDDIKQRIKISEILTYLGYDCSKNPMKCPFHETTGDGNFSFDDEKGVYHCFHEGCKFPRGNVISLYANLKNQTNGRAVRYLSKLCNLSPDEYKIKKDLKTLEKIQKNNDQSFIEYQNEVLKHIISKKPDIASEMIVNRFMNENHVYCTRDDERSEIWIYNNGVYYPNGKTHIKEFCRISLSHCHKATIVKTVIDKIEADSYIEQDDFFINEDPYLIPVKNGILNIKTKELCEFSPDFRFFNKIDIIYNPDKQNSTYSDFFLNILRNTSDVLVMQEIFGYALYRDFPIHKCFMFNGNGRNGKGKTLELLKLFVSPDNCTDLSMKDMEKDDFTINRLHNKLLNLSGDIDGGFISQSGLFKKLTGGDLVTAKRKFKTDLSFRNFSKMIFACNHLPNFGDDSHGFWERWCLLDFPYTFLKESDYNSYSKEERKKQRLKLANPDIMNDLFSENNKTSLLNWALDGLYRLLKNRQFSESNTREEVQKEWKRKSSPMFLFVDSLCVEDYGRSIPYSKLKQEYLTFCKQNGFKPESTKSYEITLTNEFGVYKERKTDTTHYIGIGLKRDLC